MAMFVLSAFTDESSPSLSGQIDAAVRNGLSHIELRQLDGKQAIEQPADKLKEAAHILAESGISVSALGSPIGKVDIDAPFAQHLEQFYRAVEAAHLLHTDRIRMFSFFMPKGKEPMAYASLVAERLNQMCDYAKHEGVLCCHENEKDIFGDNAARSAYLLQNVPDLSFVFDPANCVQCGEVPQTLYNAVLPKLSYFHAKDARKDGSVTPCGDGDGDVSALIDRYAQTNAPRILSVEPHLFDFSGLSSLQTEALTHTTHDKTPEAAFDRAVRALKALLDEKGYSYE